jgi:Glycosyltransferase
LRARKAITVSEFSARELMELYGLKREHIKVIPNGVSEDFVPRRDDRAMAELRNRIGLTSGHYVLFIGGADPRKNHQIFLEAAEMVRKKLGSRRLVLVGSPTHPFGSYEESARRRSLTEQVLCPGRLSTMICSCCILPTCLSSPRCTKGLGCRCWKRWPVGRRW